MKGPDRRGVYGMRLLRAGGRMPRAPLLFLAVAMTLAGAGCRRTNDEALKHANEAWDSGDYELAAEEYEGYLREDPASESAAEARLQLANIYYLNLGRYDQARAHYREFLSRAPSHAGAGLARERLAEVLAELGRSYEAIAEYENLNPQDEDERRRIRLRIADLYFDQKNYNQALTEYEKVTGPGAYDQMAEQAYLREASIHHIARGQFEMALPIYQKLARSSGDPEVRRRALYGMVDCFAGLYQFDDAIATLRQIKDESEQAYVARRVAEMEQRKREAAHAKSEMEKK
jgi:tetratricopeptide (TPR) repeat protein